MAIVELDKSKPGSCRETRRERRQRRRAVSQSQWAARQDHVYSDVDANQRLRLFRRYGDFTLAYSTAVQPRLTHTGDADGYIAHRSRWGTTCVLGDPVCHQRDAPDLLKRVVTEQRRPVFCQISHGTASTLAEMGYVINHMGVDTTLNLAEYSLAGKSREWLRYAWNWTQRRDYKIEEATFDTVSPKDVEQVSEAWRSTRTIRHKEVRFLNRPIVLRDEPDVRKFFLFAPDGQLLAFVFLDPLYRDGQITGYCTSFKRRHPDAPQYAEHAIMKHIIEKLKSEGVAQLKLGLSPFYNGTNLPPDATLVPQTWRTSRFNEFLFRSNYNSRLINRWFYHLQGHASYKRRFQGHEEPMYLAMPRAFCPHKLATLIVLCGIT